MSGSYPPIRHPFGYRTNTFVSRFKPEVPISTLPAPNKLLLPSSHEPPALPPAHAASMAPLRARLPKRTGHQTPVLLILSVRVPPAAPPRPGLCVPAPSRSPGAAPGVHVHTAASSLLPQGQASMRVSDSPGDLALTGPPAAAPSAPRPTPILQ